jgi:hypothetical protein
VACLINLLQGHVVPTPLKHRMQKLLCTKLYSNSSKGLEFVELKGIEPSTS